MNARKLITWAAIAGLAIGLVGCGPRQSGTDGGGEQAGTITIEGSDTMVELSNAWREEYVKTNPGIDISVKGGGSGTGVAALINGTVDFANASRNIKDEEKATAEGKGINPVEIEVAKDGIAIIANPANPVTGLTLDQLGKVYRGEITNWKDLGGPDKEIVLLSRDSSSGTYEYFKEEVVAAEDENAEYAASAKLLASSQAIVDEVTNNADAIGYVGLGYLADGMKVLEVDGTAASVETALDGSYVLSRGLFMIGNGEPAGESRAYVDWILSEAGQKIVSDQGFVPVVAK